MVPWLDRSHWITLRELGSVRPIAGPVGAVAQLGERLVRNEEVSGSIPLSSTKVLSNKVRISPEASVNGSWIQPLQGRILVPRPTSYR